LFSVAAKHFFYSFMQDSGFTNISRYHPALHIHDLHRRRMAVGIAEAQHVHRAHADADAAADARAGGIVQHLLLQRVAHHVDADLTDS